MRKVVKINSDIVLKLIYTGLDFQKISFSFDANRVLYVEDDQYKKVLDIIRNFPFSATYASCLFWYLDDKKEVPFTKIPVLKANISKKTLQDTRFNVSLEDSSSATNIDTGVQNQLVTDLASWLKKETKGTFSSFSLNFPVTFEVENQVLTVYYENTLLGDSFSNLNQKILRKRNHKNIACDDNLSQVQEILSVFFEESKLDLENVQYFDLYGDIIPEKNCIVYQKNRIEEN